MLRLAEVKLPLDHADAELTQAVLRRLRIPPDQLLEQRLVKRSIDARRRDRIKLIYSVDVRVKGEAALLRRIGNKSRVRPAPDTRYRSVGHALEGFPLVAGDRPVVVGQAPAATSLRCSWHRWGSNRCCSSGVRP